MDSTTGEFWCKYPYHCASIHCFLGAANLCLSITRFLLSVNVPHNIIRQTVHAVTSSLGHFREALRLGLVLEGVAGEVDTFDPLALQFMTQQSCNSTLTTPVNIGLDQNIHTTDTVKRNFLVLVLTPIAHFGHISAIGIVLFVSLGEHDVFVETRGQLKSFWAFLP